MARANSCACFNLERYTESWQRTFTSKGSLGETSSCCPPSKKTKLSISISLGVLLCSEYVLYDAMLSTPQLHPVPTWN